MNVTTTAATTTAGTTTAVTTKRAPAAPTTATPETTAATPAMATPETTTATTQESGQDVEDVCALSDLVPERAVAALVGGVQVALVRLLDDTVYALAQHDPFSGANVMSRGIVGSATVDGEQVPTLQSPMYKQAFDVRTGVCLTDPGVMLPTWGVLVRDGRVLVCRSPADGAPEAR